MRTIPIFKYASFLSFLILIFSVLIWTGIVKIPASPLEFNSATNKAEFNISDFATYVSSIFSTLSLIWLVVNAWQQREDLALQREEMKRNNEHQEEQAKQLERAAKTSSENLKMQREIYFRELISNKIKALTGAIFAAKDRYVIYYGILVNEEDDGFGNHPLETYNILFKFPRDVGNNYFLEDLVYVSNSLKNQIYTYQKNQIENKIVKITVEDNDTLDLAYIQQIAKTIKLSLSEATAEPDSLDLPEFLFFYDFFDRLDDFFKLYVRSLDRQKNVL